MRKNRRRKIKNRKTFIIWLLIIAGIFIFSRRIIKGKSDVDQALEKLEEFKHMEEICGKGNVRSKCKYGLCDNDFGLTCYYWSKAARRAEKKK